ncbi:MAG: phosphatase PAP2 family protein [Mangrovibacterium sp.]
MESIITLDKSVFFFLNGMHSPVFDVAMSLFTRAEFWLLLFMAIVVSIIKIFGKKAILILVAIALVVLVADQFSGLIKDLVGRLRPTHDPTMQDLVHFVKKRGGKFSYFSSHAANTFGVAMYLTLLFKNKTFGFTIFVWAAIASYTRIYLGLHFPGDILTGIAFGLLIGWLLYLLTIFLDKRFFVLASPKISEAKLAAGQSQTILLVMIGLVFMAFLVASKLLHVGLITL